MAQFGRALRSGRRGRGFESRRFDSLAGAPEILEKSRISGLFLLLHILFCDICTILMSYTPDTVSKRISCSPFGSPISQIHLISTVFFIQKKHKKRPELVVLETDLSGLDGFTLAKKIRKEEPKTALIFLGQKSYEEAKEALD